MLAPEKGGLKERQKLIAATVGMRSDQGTELSVKTSDCRRKIHSRSEKLSEISSRTSKDIRKDIRVVRMCRG